MSLSPSPTVGGREILDHRAETGFGWPSLHDPVCHGDLHDGILNQFGKGRVREVGVDGDGILRSALGVIEGFAGAQ